MNNEILELCPRCYREGHMAMAIVTLTLLDMECECKCCKVRRS